MPPAGYSQGSRPTNGNILIRVKKRHSRCLMLPTMQILAVSWAGEMMVYGDRTLICSCPPLEDYEFEESVIDVMRRMSGCADVQMTKKNICC